MTRVTTPAPDQQHWTDVAAEWIRWARSPGHDVFWHYRAALADFVGAGTATALEVGCGEGRVSRELRALGYRVTAGDVVPALVAAARDADSADGYFVAGATELPFDTGSFGLVVAYNVLMDVADVPAAARELARVLADDGTVIVSLVHPFADRGRFAGEAPGAAFVLNESYFGIRRFEGTETRDGLSMHFAGWSQPLENYVAAFAGAGLAITGLSEPRPAPGSAAEECWSRVPLFLWMKLRKITAPPTVGIESS